MTDYIHRPAKPIAHRNDEYEESGHPQLLRMQQEHFWYRGRHRFLLRAIDAEVRGRGGSAVDLGGGCGGWLKYLHEHRPGLFAELALADSSLHALTLAGPGVREIAERHQADLYDLGWRERWDVIFLLDVIEHLQDDATVLRQVEAALRPGGLLFVTTPALPFFHSYNDVLVHHLRRYTRADFKRLANECGLVLRRARYFMFFLSPLMLMRRWFVPDLETMTADDISDHLARTHDLPPAPVNQILRFIFSLETPLGWHLAFPWGTSILGVFEKPAQPDLGRPARAM